MRVDLQQLKHEIATIAEVHGVDLVAVEWALGPGRGVLRIFIDRPGGDPRTAAELRSEGATADLCAAVSRDVGAALDTHDLITYPYDLEVSSPGFERPVQKREDFDRFAGLVIKVRTRTPVPVEGGGARGSFEGTLRGTADDADGDFKVRVEVGGRVAEIPSREIARARLAEIKAPPPAKPGKGGKKHKAPETKQPEGAPSVPRGERDGEDPTDDAETRPDGSGVER